MKKLILELPFVVEVRERNFWEAIAAFNVRSVAVYYVKECRAGAKSRKMPLQYRVAPANRYPQVIEGR